jgi:hypothetical protein
MFVKSLFTSFSGAARGPRPMPLASRVLSPDAREYRAALRAGDAGGRLTPTGYAILAVMAAAVALVAMLSASPVGNELSRAPRLIWWFS